MTLNNVYIRVDWPESQNWTDFEEVVLAAIDDGDDVYPIAFVPNQIYSGYIKGTPKKADGLSQDDSPSQPSAGQA